MLNLMLMAAKGGRPRKGATRKAPPPPKRRVPWWMWLVVPALLAAFVFVLVKLASVQPSPTPSKAAVVTPKPVAPKPATKPAPKKEAAAAPAENNRETFEFYQLLQDSEVDTSHVDAYHYTPRGEQDFYYMVQAASFRSNEEADRLRAQLILSGLEASIRETTGSNGQPWYRVVVGPFDTRSAENRAQDKLVDMGIESYTYKVKKEQ